MVKGLAERFGVWPKLLLRDLRIWLLRWQRERLSWHATRDRDQVIAQALGGLARQAKANVPNQPQNPRTAW